MRARPAARARLEVAHAVIAVGDHLPYTILNAGEVPLLYGYDGSIEWRHRFEWVSLPLGGWVPAIGKRIEPGRRSDLETHQMTEILAPGRYRLVKRLSSLETIPSPGSITIKCEFAVDLGVLGTESVREGEG